MERKYSQPREVKNLDEQGHFSGYASVFNNIDYGNDIIAPNAFKTFLTNQKGKLRIIFNHDVDKVIGLAEFSQDEKGLLVDGQINLNVSYARDVYELMKDGALDGMSIGFNILEAQNEKREGRKVRVIKSAELWEASIVTFGMNPQAGVTQVKSCIESFDEYKNALMGLPGITPEKAKAAALASYKAVCEEAEDNEEILKKEIQSIISNIKQFSFQESA